MNHKFYWTRCDHETRHAEGLRLWSEDIKAKHHIGIVNTITKGRRGMSIYVNSQKSSSRGFGQRAEFRSNSGPIHMR